MQSGSEHQVVVLAALSIDVGELIRRGRFLHLDKHQSPKSRALLGPRTRGAWKACSEANPPVRLEARTDLMTGNQFP